MDAANIRLQVSKFEKARNSLLAIIALIAVNTALVFLGSTFTFWIQPSIFFHLAYPGPAMAIVGVIIYVVCFLLAKKVRAFLLIAFIIFLFDTLVFGLFVLLDWFDGWFEILNLLDLAFHIYILVALGMGLTAWGKLGKISATDMAAALDGVTDAELLDENFDGNIYDEELDEELDEEFYEEDEEIYEEEFSEEDEEDFK